jgi:hypothetical protein
MSVKTKAGEFQKLWYSIKIGVVFGFSDVSVADSE